MSALAVVTGPATVTRPASGRPGYLGKPRARQRVTALQVAPVPPAGETADGAVTVTISIDGGDPAARERVLSALRGLVEAAGSDATVAVGGVTVDGVTPDGAERVAGAITLDPRPRTVNRDGWPLHLSRLEYDLLLFLARHPRRVFSRSQLLAQVWGHTHTTARTVDVHVSRLRTKLGDQDLITTVYGLGYRLADDALVSVAGE